MNTQTRICRYPLTAVSALVILATGRTMAAQGAYGLTTGSFIFSVRTNLYTPQPGQNTTITGYRPAWQRVSTGTLAGSQLRYSTVLAMTSIPVAGVKGSIAARIIINETPNNGLGVPLMNPVFKGRVVDASGKGVAGVAVGVHDPVLRRSVAGSRTDMDGKWTYTTCTISTEGVYPFTFILDSDNRKTASYVLSTRVTTRPVSSQFKVDTITYLPGKIENIGALAEAGDLQYYLLVQSGASVTFAPEQWARGEKAWKNRMASVQESGSFQDGVNIVVYATQGAVCAASVVGTGATTSALACAPLVIHLASDGSKRALDNMYNKKIIDKATWQNAQKARVVVVSVSSVAVAGAADPTTPLGMAAQDAKIGLSVVEGTASVLDYENINGKQRTVINAVGQGSKLTKALVSVSTIGVK